VIIQILILYCKSTKIINNCIKLNFKSKHKRKVLAVVKELRTKVFLKYFLACSIWLLVFSDFFYNEPELGIEIDPGMALTPLPSSMGRGSNPRREPNSSKTLSHLSNFETMFFFGLIV